MNDTLQALVQYGYALVGAFVLAEQIGLPVPAVPVLLGVGALAGWGRLCLLSPRGARLGPSLVADLIWYELGRRRGNRVLRHLCRISLEPDSCVRRTEDLFVRQGRKTLLFAKFLPGLSTVAPPLAGMVGIARPQFIALDIAAAVLWAGTWMGLGDGFPAGKLDRRRHRRGIRHVRPGQVRPAPAISPGAQDRADRPGRAQGS